MAVVHVSGGHRSLKTPSSFSMKTRDPQPKKEPVTSRFSQNAHTTYKQRCLGLVAMTDTTYFLQLCCLQCWTQAVEWSCVSSFLQSFSDETDNVHFYGYAECTKHRREKVTGSHGLDGDHQLLYHSMVMAVLCLLHVVNWLHCTFPGVH